MTKAQTKKALNAELKSKGFVNLVSKVGDVGANTLLGFESAIDARLSEWLNDRYTHGITIYPEDASVCKINTPQDAAEALTAFIGDKASRIVDVVYYDGKGNHSMLVDDIATWRFTDESSRWRAKFFKDLLENGRAYSNFGGIYFLRPSGPEEIAELTLKLANAYVTYARCSGHGKADRNEQLVKTYKAQLTAASLPIPEDDKLSEMGTFNGDGSY